MMKRDRMLFISARSAILMFALLVCSCFIFAVLMLGADLGKNQLRYQEDSSGVSNKKAETKPEADNKLSNKHQTQYTLHPPGFETNFAGKVAFDERYQCDMVSKKADGDGSPRVVGLVYLWVRANAESFEAKYLLSRDEGFQTSVFKVENSRWKRVEGGNAERMCFDIYAHSNSEGKGRHGCAFAFDRAFPEISQFDSLGHTLSQGVCRRINP